MNAGVISMRSTASRAGTSFAAAASLASITPSSAPATVGNSTSSAAGGASITSSLAISLGANESDSELRKRSRFDSTAWLPPRSFLPNQRSSRRTAWKKPNRCGSASSRAITARGCLRFGVGM